MFRCVCVLGGGCVCIELFQILISIPSADFLYFSTQICFISNNLKTWQGMKNLQVWLDIGERNGEINLRVG